MNGLFSWILDISRPFEIRLFFKNREFFEQVLKCFCLFLGVKIQTTQELFIQSYISIEEFLIFGKSSLSIKMESLRKLKVKTLDNQTYSLEVNSEV